MEVESPAHNLLVSNGEQCPEIDNALGLNIGQNGGIIMYYAAAPNTSGYIQALTDDMRSARDEGSLSDRSNELELAASPTYPLWSVAPSAASCSLVSSVDSGRIMPPAASALQRLSILPGLRSSAPAQLPPRVLPLLFPALSKEVNNRLQEHHKVIGLK
ncbi:hypothetical protein FRC11_006157 [Ceratobasidium sp. 423]|nr:hypothetical protein FRC11_006157 [Ceratobasidium sp. 423]